LQAAEMADSKAIPPVEPRAGSAPDRPGETMSEIDLEDIELAEVIMRGYGLYRIGDPEPNR
jgi:hypothetical protein